MTGTEGPTEKVYGFFTAGGYNKYIAPKNYSLEKKSSMFYHDNQSCYLPSLEPYRAGHTMSGLVACGGNGIDDMIVNNTCSKFDLTDGRWKPYATLPIPRKNHMAWETNEGILLMGGTKPSLLVKPDGSTEERFRLTPPSIRACAVQDDRTSSVYILGGSVKKEVHSNVTRYGNSGFLESLPNMNYKRKNLGCAGYYDNNNKV